MAVSGGVWFQLLGCFGFPQFVVLAASHFCFYKTSHGLVVPADGHAEGSDPQGSPKLGDGLDITTMSVFLSLMLTFWFSGCHSAS